MPWKMRADSALGSPFDLGATPIAGIGREAIGVHGGRRNAELSRSGGAATGEGINPRPKRLVPILHGFRNHSEPDKKQLSLFENLNPHGIAGELPTIVGVRDIDFDSKAPVQPFGEEDDPITEFVRWTLAELKKKRGDMHALQFRSGISSGYFTKLVNDKERVMRVGMDFIRKFAPAMGYEDLGEFFFASGKWWEETGRALISQYKSPETIADPELRHAVDSAKGIATREVVERVMADYPNHIGKKNSWWWIERMIEIAKDDFHRNAERVVEKKTKVEERRALNKARTAAPESSRTLAGEAPPAAPPSSAAKVAGTKKRRLVK